MAKGKHNNGCSEVILVVLVLAFLGGGLAAVGKLFLYAIGLYLAVIAIWLYFICSAPNPNRSVTHSKTWMGDKKKTIEYHDSGKEIQQVSGQNWLGQRTKKTYVTKPGQHSSQARAQTCRTCGASVASTNGSYYCACGRRWGRR